MSRKAAGAREARALLDVATRESDPDRVGAELDAIADAMRTQPEVQACCSARGCRLRAGCRRCSSLRPASD